MTYADHRRQSHQISALRPARPDDRPPLPIAPVRGARAGARTAGSPPGSVIRFETHYAGAVPTLRRIDGSGRFLWDAVSEVLGWTPGLALDVTLGPGHWATLRSAGRPRDAVDRRLAHVDKSGRVVIPSGVRTYLGTDTGEEIVVRIDAAAGALQVADASLLARALDVLDRFEARAGANAPVSAGDPTLLRRPDRVAIAPPGAARTVRGG